MTQHVQSLYLAVFCRARPLVGKKNSSSLAAAAAVSDPWQAFSVSSEKIYNKCSKIASTFQIKCWFSGLEFTKCVSDYQTGNTLIRLLLQKQSDLGLRCLSRPSGQAISIKKIRYGKFSKLSCTFLFLFSNKMLISMAGIHKMLLRITNMEDPDQLSNDQPAFSGSTQHV